MSKRRVHLLALISVKTESVWGKHIHKGNRWPLIKSVAPCGCERWDIGLLKSSKLRKVKLHCGIHKVNYTSDYILLPKLVFRKAYYRARPNSKTTFIGGTRMISLALP